MTSKWLTNLHTNSVLKDENISLELIEKYKKDCLSLLPPSLFEIKQIEGDETNPLHLLWMLQQIETNVNMSLTKRHRWLGYIQGILVSHGVFSVQEEREYTRPIFKGA